ncbi:MAG: molybdopterin-binding protein [Paracoccaceae bacterium]|nr:molybdopterin-binding protein [Paracoccaceae bacterium]
MPDRLPDDCFALPPGVDWTPVDEALDLLRAKLTCVTATETIALAEGAGRVLAEPLTAQRTNPPHANSAIDGYAFAWSSLAGGETGDLILIEGRAAAGHAFTGTVPEGAAIRILTGAEMPDGADTVVLQEDAEASDGRVRFRAPRKQGANARKAGEDAETGAEVLPVGRVLTPADLARAAAVGITDLPVRKRLRVAVLSTGDELIQPGADPAMPGIFDANRPMLSALAAAQGYEIADLGAMPDAANAIASALDRGAAEADAILTSGGASSGDEDHLSRLLTGAGDMVTWRIAVKPGRPLALGFWNGVPVFGLPGNPVAAFVCFLVFARPALGAMAGAGWREPQAFTVPAAFEKSKKPGRREYLRARLDGNGAAEVFRSEGSGLIGGLSWSDGLVELPDGALDIRPGDPVRYLPYTSFGIGP